MNYIVQAVILVYFVGMFALGILGEQRTKNTADYYVAGRQVNGFFAGIVSVSYTHLDVYKRQPQHFLPLTLQPYEPQVTHSNNSH